ncbi:MAG: UDP-2,3-diacylglucosamine diphosphatase [Fibrobacteres bacterium]|nr:UDP-2,3-diacylglucosamine diphosphatase [Fibrobacterota bacterium]
MKKYYFLSDAHFGALKGVSPGAEEDFVALCDRIAVDAERLYFLGDLFDFFFDYNSVVPRNYFRIQYAIHKLISSGVPVVYVSGNHDFWLGDFLEKEVGIQVAEGAVQIEACNLKINLQHGDCFLKGEKDTRSFFGKIVKSSINRKLYRLLHPDFAVPFALKISEFSRKRTERKIDKEKIMHSFRMRAQNFLSESDVNAVLVGHTHFKDMVQLKNKTYINTGNWMVDRDYAVLENGVFSLRTFARDQ